MSTVAMILFISIITLSVPCFWSNKENEALKQLECTQQELHLSGHTFGFCLRDQDLEICWF